MSSYDFEEKVRERAYRIWLEEGQPEGKAEEHWERARLIVGTEEGLSSTLLRPEPPGPEPKEALENQGEFPTLTDQGEQQNPQWPQPANS